MDELSQFPAAEAPGPSTFNVDDKRVAERQVIATLVHFPELYSEAAVLQLSEISDAEMREHFKIMQEAMENGRRYVPTDFPIIFNTVGTPQETIPSYMVGELVQRIREQAYKAKVLRHTEEIAQAVKTEDIEVIQEILETDLADYELSSVHPWLESRRTLETALQPRPPREYAIEGVIKIPSLNIVYGPPGGFKTKLLLDAQGHIVQGMKWLTLMEGEDEYTLGFETNLMPCLYIDFDSGRHDMDESVEAMARGVGLTSSDLFSYYSMPMPRLDCRDLRSIKMLKSACRDQRAKVDPNRPKAGVRFHNGFRSGKNLITAG